jgi:hypothetical protein
MHDKDTKSLTLRVSTSNSFTISNGSEMVTQIVSNCSNAGNGSNWVLTIKDRVANAHTWFGPITLGVSSNGPMITRFDSPVRFSDGIVATTTGNFGVLDLSVSVLNTKGL